MTTLRRRVARWGGATALLLTAGVISYYCLFGLPAGDSARRNLAGGLPGTSSSGLESPRCQIQLRDVTGETGIAFRHTDGSSGRRYMVEPMSAGLATFDFDNDGLIDIYFCNGAPLPGLTVDSQPRHALYRNLGGWMFQEVTDQAGVGSTAYGLGIAVGDYNADGFPDIYLNNFGPNVLYVNNGDGTFRDATAEAGVARGQLVSAGVCFLDMDADSDLDLYVGNYIAYDCSTHVTRMADGIPAYRLPSEYEPVPDTLYRNDGDGTFADVSVESGVASCAGRSMGMICADYDDDCDTDVFICNDVQENFLFRNDGHGRFEEVAVLVGAAVNSRGEILANMAVDCGDYDRDGQFDFFTTNYRGQVPMLLRNLGRGALEDVFQASPAAGSFYPHVNWGCAFCDFDNDADLDVFVANGHTEDNIEIRDSGGMYRVPNIVLANQGNGQFVDVSAFVGDGLQPVLASRGVAVDDLDNDGDVDAVVLNSREKPTIIRNMLSEMRGDEHWLQLSLRGVASNRDGVGARVTVVSGQLTQTAEVHSGRSYQSHWGSRLHFGLGNRDRVQRIEIRWVGGATDVLEDLGVNQHLLVVQSLVNAHQSRVH